MQRRATDAANTLVDTYAQRAKCSEVTNYIYTKAKR